MKIYKNFCVEKWDISTEQLIISFWESRKILFEKKSERSFEGKRGSILGNLISYDMHKLITKLNIISNANEVRCELDIKTFGQLITKWNKEFWELELETFESVLLNNNYKEIEWEKYYISTSKKNLYWTLLPFVLGVLAYGVVQVIL